MDKSTFVRILLGYTVATSGLVVLATRWSTPGVKASMSMAAGLLLIWILLLGGLMYYFRDGIKTIVIAIPLPYWLKFFIMFLLLGLLEEAVTVSMTNLAPFFGAEIGQAYITASTSYLDVVLYHSIILFVPMMIGWTWLLSKYDFSPFQAFLFWGLSGWLMELAFSGLSQALAFGFWIFVYGLMIWLAAYCLPERKRKPVGLSHYLFLFIVPFACFVAMMVLFTILGAIFPGSYFHAMQDHPKFHFGPIS